MNPCERRCRDCGNVAMHEDNITPWVLCKKCGSQDTRLVKPTPEMQKIAEQREHSEAGALLAKCDSYVVAKAEDGGLSAIIVIGEQHWIGAGTTQLAAIKAAVEAAEKGVRE